MNQQLIQILETVLKTNKKINAETKDGYVFISSVSTNKIYISHDIRMSDGTYSTRQIWGNVSEMAAYLEECGIKIK